MGLSIIAYSVIAIVSVLSLIAYYNRTKLADVLNSNNLDNSTSNNSTSNNSASNNSTSNNSTSNNSTGDTSSSLSNILIKQPDNAAIANIDLINMLASAPATTGVISSPAPKIDVAAINAPPPDTTLIDMLAQVPTTTPISTTPIVNTSTSYKRLSDMDFPSNDMKFIQGDLNMCETECESSIGCVGYVADKSNTNCTLKYRLAPPGVVDTSRDTYYKGRQYLYKAKWNYPGNDIKYYVGKFEACPVACDNTPGCVGYTLQLDNGANCWLKSKLTAPGASTPTRDIYYIDGAL